MGHVNATVLSLSGLLFLLPAFSADVGCGCVGVHREHAEGVRRAGADDELRLHRGQSARYELQPDVSVLKEYTIRRSSSVKFGDVDGNGKSDFFVLTPNCGGHMFNHDGREFWSYATDEESAKKRADFEARRRWQTGTARAAERGRRSSLPRVRRPDRVEAPAEHTQQLQVGSFLRGVPGPHIAANARTYARNGEAGLGGPVHWFDARGNLLSKWPANPLNGNPDFVKGDSKGDGKEELFWCRFRMDDWVEGCSRSGRTCITCSTSWAKAQNR